MEELIKLLTKEIEVKFLLTMDGAKEPQKATDGAAAFDVYSPQDFFVPEGRSVMPLGVALEMPVFIKANIRNRSGFALKGIEGYKGNWVDISEEEMKMLKIETSRFDCDEKLGLIDSDYRNHIGLIFYNKDVPFTIKAGTRICQLEFGFVPNIVLKQVEELSRTERGEGGFGHSGTK